MNIDSVEAQVIESVKAIPALFPNGAGDALWTQAIKLSIGKLGRTIDYRTCTSGFREEFDGEWLFDLCWYATTPDGHLLEILLAVESEWNRRFDAIRYDFEKLLVAKAKLKLMIFQASGSQMEDYFHRLTKGVAAYKGGSDGEVYILACFDETQWKFVLRRIPEKAEPGARANDHACHASC